MPTLSSGINTALQAVLANSQAIEVIEHNIANANTAGYRRQSAVLSATVTSRMSSIDHGIGAGLIGSGVRVEQIRRFNFEFFDTQFRNVSCDTGNWEAQRDILLQLEKTLAETTDSGLFAKLDKFWAGLQSLAADPGNMTTRNLLLNQSQVLCDAFNTRAKEMTQLRYEQNGVLSTRAEEINNLTGQIANLNAEISRVLSVGDQPNDLLDKRDILLDNLSNLCGSVSFAQQNGEVVVSIGGHVAVTGHDSNKIVTKTEDSGGFSKTALVWEDGQAFTPPSGEVHGILQIRDVTIPGMQADLDALAKKFVEEVNAIHTTGYGLDNTHGINFFNGDSAGSICLNPNLTAVSIGASSNLNEPGNNDIATKLAELKTSKVFNGGTVTINEFYNSQVTALAQKVNNARNNAADKTLILKALNNQRESLTGVSLDEEAAYLVKVQRASQAAARVMTAYDELLNQIINNMGIVGR